MRKNTRELDHDREFVTATLRSLPTGYSMFDTQAVINDPGMWACNQHAALMRQHKFSGVIKQIKPYSIRMDSRPIERKIQLYVGKGRAFEAADPGLTSGNYQPSAQSVPYETALVATFWSKKEKGQDFFVPQTMLADICTALMIRTANASELFDFHNQNPGVVRKLEYGYQRILAVGDVALSHFVAEVDTVAHLTRVVMPSNLEGRSVLFFYYVP